MYRTEKTRKHLAKNYLTFIEHQIKDVMNNIEVAKKTLEEEDNQVYRKTIIELKALYMRTKTYSNKAKLLIGDIAYIPHLNKVE